MSELGKTYLVVLGNEGFESLLCLSDWEEKHLHNNVFGKDDPISESCQYNSMQLSIRFNMHRNPGGYIITVPMEPEEFRDELINSIHLRKLVKEKGEVHWRPYPRGTEE